MPAAAAGAGRVFAALRASLDDARRETVLRALSADVRRTVLTMIGRARLGHIGGCRR